MSTSRWMTLAGSLALLPLACGGDDGGSADEIATAATAEGSEAESGNTAESGTSTGESTDAAESTSEDTGEATSEGTGESTSEGTGESTSEGTTEGGTTSGTTSDTGESTTGEPVCPLAEAHVPCDGQDNDPFHAIGVGCPGDSPASTPITATTFTSPDASAWRVATQFGSSGDWAAHEGDKLLIISTGSLEPANGQRQVILDAKSAQIGTPNGNQDNVANLPNPIEPQDGSGGTPFMNCDGTNDCSDTLEAQWMLGGERANDLLFFEFDVEVPAEANGYLFDFAFFSSEFPEWVDTQFNDVFVVWSTSETYTGNVTFIDGQPLTVTALAGSITHEGNDPQLLGTGVDGVGGGPMGQGMMEPVGGATGWFTASGSAAPGETFTLAWAVFDMGDAYYDTSVILDAFRWDCEGCTPSEVDGCGIDPQ